MCAVPALEKKNISFIWQSLDFFLSSPPALHSPLLLLGELFAHGSSQLPANTVWQCFRTPSWLLQDTCSKGWFTTIETYLPNNALRAFYRVPWELPLSQSYSEESPKEKKKKKVEQQSSKGEYIDFGISQVCLTCPGLRISFCGKQSFR